MSFDPLPFLKKKGILFKSVNKKDKSYNIKLLSYWEVEIDKVFAKGMNLETILESIPYIETSKSKAIDYSINAITNRDINKNFVSEDELKEMIVTALSDERFDFRTIEGIGKTLGLPKDIIIKGINLNSNLIRKSWAKDPRGRDLYTLASKSMRFREFLAVLQTFLAKSYL